MKLVIFPALAALGCPLVWQSSRAATFTVTTTANAGAGSLREAVNLANAAAGADTIVFDTAGAFSTAQTITLGGGQIQITGAVTINAPGGGAQRVTVDGANLSRVFHIQLPGSGTVLLRNLDVTRGLTADDGGAIQNASPAGAALELVDCYIYNSAARHGGGIDAGVASLVLTDTSVNYNEASGRGGGIHSRGVVTVTRGEILQNDAEGDGGGLRLDGGSATLTEAEVTTNFAGRGAGLHLSNAATLTMTGGMLNSNRATDAGGGVRAVGASVVNLRRVRVSDNRADEGGGLALRQSTLAATNTLFVLNQATGEGGGIRFNTGSTGVLKNCTVSGNSGGPEGAGLSVTNASVSLGNTVVAENPLYSGDDLMGSFFSLGHNLIGSLGAATGFSNGVDGDIVGGENGSPRVEANLDSGPHTFVPLPRSRCLENGDSTLVSSPDYGSAPFLDALGAPRVRGVVDIGAIEGAFNVIVTNANDSGPGSLRQALAGVPTDISFDAGFFGTTLRTITLTSGQITLSSDLSVVGPAPGVRISGNNASRVFNIIGGRIALKRVRIIEGASTGDGGGVRVLNNGTTLSLDDAGISNSAAVGRGGGLYIQDASVVTATHSTFSNNTADGDGGGIHVNGATLHLTNSTVSTNSTKAGGGGLYAGGTGTTNIINCTVADNTCDSDATGAPGNGGGLRRNAGTVRVGNTVVARNADASGAVVQPDISGIFTSLGHNLIGVVDGLDASGGTPFQNGIQGDLAGTGASPLAPGLNALQQNPATSPTRVHPLQAGSPARDAGDSSLLSHAAWPSTPVGSDQRGQFREIGTAVDMGAVEYPDANVVKLNLESPSLSEFLLQPTRLKVRRSYDDGANLVVTLSTAGSTIGGGDILFSGASYTPTGPSTFTVTIPAGSTSVQLTLTPFDDSAAEGAETLSLALVAGAGYQLDTGDPASHLLTLYDDEYTLTSAAASGAGTLREAVTQANAGGGGVISIPAGYSIPLGGSPLVLTGDIQITSPGATLDAGGNSRVFRIDNDGGPVGLTGLDITGGSASGGGAISLEAYGNLSLTSCRLRGNRSTGQGGALLADTGSTLLLTQCAVVDNVASGSGGGLAGSTAELQATNVTIAGNTSGSDGGGVYSFSGSIALTGCTLTGNVADSQGIGLGNGGGVYALAADLDLANTVIAGNFDTPGNAGPGSTSPDVGDNTATWGVVLRNFFGSNAGIAHQIPAQQPGPGGNFAGSAAQPIDARLRRIDGPVTTYCEFDYASQLRDSGSNLAATAPTDQRSYPRIDSGTVDIGAVEMDFKVVTSVDSSGAGTLREALSLSAAAGHGTIVFSSTVFNTPRTIATGGFEFAVLSGVTIWGPTDPAARLTLSGGGAQRVFNVAAPGQAVEFRNLDIADSHTAAYPIGNRAGGGLLVAALSTVTLVDCTVRDCTAQSEGAGAHVSAGGRLIARDTTFARNVASLQGGAVSNFGELTLLRVTLSGNTAGTSGGAIFNAADAILTNCTLSGNLANGHGGGIENAAGVSNTLTLTHCTLTQNLANANAVGTEHAGGIRVTSGLARLRATLVSGNDALGSAQDDLTGSFTTLGHNLVGTTAGAAGILPGVANDLVGASPYLGPLRLNGGSTATHALGAASSAVNAAGLSLGLTDQRGLPRPGAADIGAYELQPEAYTYWASHTFPASASASLTGDFDGDGFTNGYEYAAGSDPTQPASLPFTQVTPTSGQLEISAAVSPLLLTGSLVAHSSTDLASWSLIPPAQFSNAGFTPSGQAHLIRLTLPLSPDRQFIRLTFQP